MSVVKYQLLMNTSVEVDIGIVIRYILNKFFSRQICNLFIFFEQRGRATAAVFHDFFSGVELSYDGFSSIFGKIMGWALWLHHHW